MQFNIHETVVFYRQSLFLPPEGECDPHSSQNYTSSVSGDGNVECNDVTNDCILTCNNKTVIKNTTFNTYLTCSGTLTDIHLQCEGKIPCILQ